MKSTTHSLQNWNLVALALIVTAGCLESEDTLVASTTQNVFAGNGLRVNGLRVNGLRVNGVDYNALGYNGNGFDGINYNGLNYQALLQNEVWQLWMTDSKFEDQDQVFDYLVACALEPGQTIAAIEIGDETFGPWEGQLGLAPNWYLSGNDEQSLAEQRRVSACLVALINALGEHVTVSMRSVDMDTPSTMELVDYTRFEGQFFGNLFGETEVLKVCRATGESNMASDEELRAASRLCASDPESCELDDVGSCAAACDDFDWTQGVYASCNGYPAVGVYIPENLI